MLYRIEAEGPRALSLGSIYVGENETLANSGGAHCCEHTRGRESGGGLGKTSVISPGIYRGSGDSGGPSLGLRAGALVMRDA